MLDENAMISSKLFRIPVIPAQAGIQVPFEMDSRRLRGNDGGLSIFPLLDSSDG